MPLFAIIPVVAAVASFATVGVTAFTVIAAVGAVAAAVGTFTKVKELQIAGTVLGLVGGIGALASSTGMFASEAANLASGVTEGAGAAAAGLSEAVTPLAVDAGSDFLAAGGNLYGSSAEYISSAANALPGGAEAVLPGFGVSNAAPTSDIINLVNGVGQTNFTAISPAEQVLKATTESPATQALPDVTTQQLRADVPANLESQSPFSSEGLINQQTDVALNQNVTDQFGGQVNQGAGDPLGGGGETSNPWADPTYPDQSQTPLNQQELNQRIPGADPASGTPPPTPRGPGQGPTPGDARVPGQSPKPVSAQVNPADMAKQAANDSIINAASGTGDISRTSSTLSPAGSLPAGDLKATQDPGIFGNIIKWAEKHQTLTLGGLMLASSGLSGMFKAGAEGQTAELAAKYMAEADRNHAAAALDYSQNELLQRRLENMKGPLPQARWIDPSRNPPVSLINSPYGTPTGAVTGKVTV